MAPEFVYDGTLLGAAEMLRGGVTCCNDMYFYPDAAARAYETAGMRALLGMPVLDFPTPYAPDADAYLQRGLAARDAFKHAPLLAFALAPHAPYTVGDATWEKIVMYCAAARPARSRRTSPKRAHEVDEALRATGITPLARLDRLGATGPAFIAIHAVHVEAADMATSRRAGLPCRALPGVQHEARAAASRRSRNCSRQGINVALGTRRRRVQQPSRPLGRNAPRRACSPRWRAGTRRRCRPPSALRMATLNGAARTGTRRADGVARAGQAGRSRRHRPVGHRHVADVRSGFAPRLCGRSRVRHRRLGRRRTRRGGPPAHHDRRNSAAGAHARVAAATVRNSNRN